MRNKINYRARLRIIIKAYKFGWDLHRSNEWSYVFKRTTPKGGHQTMNVYWNKKNNLFTTVSALDHPKHGKTAMTRRFCDLQLVNQLLINPRQHTGRGYKRKKR